MTGNNEIQIFNYENNQVRTVEKDGAIWFVAKDVCDILEISKYRDAISRLDDDERASVKVDTLGGIQEMAAINESGLYALVFRSNKPEAKKFSRWVRDTVLPSIRKHGAYITPDTMDKIISDPTFGIKLLEALQSEREKAAALEAEKKQLEAQAVIDKPKVLFADSVSASEDSILVRDLAKLLRQNGYKTGERLLYAEFRRRGFIMKNSTMPTQKSMNMGLMEIKESSILRGDGDTFVRRTTKITGKGQIYFCNMFLNNGGDLS